MSQPLPFPNINDTAANDVQTWSSNKILDYLKPALETEVVTSKNLFSGIGETGKYLSDTGEERTGDAWNISNYIGVKPETTYTFTPNSTSGASASFCFYDSAKVFISSVNSSVLTFTTPADCRYVRLSLRTTSTNVQLEEGSESTTYEPYETDTIENILKERGII